jgi:hypothetical protein
MIHWIWKRLTPAPGRSARDGKESWSVTINPETRVSTHADGLTFLHIPSGRVFVCNRTGARIWHALSNGLSPDAVCQEISRVYGLAPDLARRDTRSFLGELARHGLAARTVR